MKIKVAFLALALHSSSLFAGGSVDKDLAIEYLKVSKIEGAVNSSVQQYEEQLFGNAKPEDKAKFHEMLVGSVGWDAIKDQLATIVMNIYTKEEIEAQINFIKSPLGASATNKNEEFSRQFTAAVSENIKKVMVQCCSEKK